MAKYGAKASEKVEKAMHERKRGALKSGSGKKVTSKKQAIAIGLSQARRAGGKVPKKKSSSKKSSAKESSGKELSVKESFSRTLRTRPGHRQRCPLLRSLGCVAIKGAAVHIGQTTGQATQSVSAIALQAVSKIWATPRVTCTPCAIFRSRLNKAR